MHARFSSSVGHLVRYFNSTGFSSLLGSRESGKSTILKQMKIIHQDGFSEAELAEYTTTIYRDVLESAQSLVTFMKKIGVECEQYSNRVCRFLSHPYVLPHFTSRD